MSKNKDTDNPVFEVYESSADKKKNLLLFFERPSEPCFMPKGGKVLQIPDNFFPEKYRSASNELTSRFGEDSTSIPLGNIAIPSELSLPLQLPYNDQFSLFIPKHRRMAAKLIDIFMSMRNVDDLMSLCSYCQLRINPYMFNYCLSVALLHRDDTKGLNIPTFSSTFPDKFFNPKIFPRAREVSKLEEKGQRIPILIPQNFTASDAEPEQAVAYFREDIGINLHHWHWHLVYPFESANTDIVNKDRRGELFYYMHQQIIARYNAERLCNKMARVRPYNDYQEPIEEAYFPKLDSQVASRSWPPRFAGTRIRDMQRPVDEINIEVNQLENWRMRFIEAIDNMSVVLPGGESKVLDEQTGIDVLGNIMEASSLSPNSSYYGNLHNMGHVFISYSHDPDHRNLEQYGVMGDSATAMRDPIFYRWHTHINDLFQLYKNKLPPYGPSRLSFPGIRVTSINIQSPAGSNVISTYWEQSTLELGRGMDFLPRNSVLARITHLQHDEFNYVIRVTNTSRSPKMSTVRIFIAPMMDENGQPLTFDEQRRLMIELDKFTKNIPVGTSSISRNSIESSVTIPYERTFTDQTKRPGDSGSQRAADFDFCGCGWPHHMLIPKGTEEGYPMVLFCMLSNWNDDRIQQVTVGTCSDAASFCGIRDRKYPDKRAMGFPFDRPANVDSLGSFMTSNMIATQCTIKFSSEVRQREQ